VNFLSLAAKDIFCCQRKKSFASIKRSRPKIALQSGTIVTLSNAKRLEVPEGVMDILKAYYHTPQQPKAQPWAIG